MVSPRFQFQNSSLLGTVVDLTVEVGDGVVAEHVANDFFHEVERLQAVFSAFDEDSELSRWRTGRVSGRALSAEFTQLMGQARRWQALTNGLFNPMVGLLTDRWLASGEGPVPEDLLRLSDSIAEPRFEMIDGLPVVTGDCQHFNLNAVAKGFIVDQAMAFTQNQMPVDGLIVNAGGDIGHVGSTPIRVGIENPALPYDNESPMAVIEICGEAVATSGSGRRSIEVDGRRYNHLIDPRTGQPVAATASVTVVAGSAMVADVMATALAVVEPPEGLDLVDRLTETQPLLAMIVDNDQARHYSSGWSDRFG